MRVEVEVDLLAHGGQRVAGDGVGAVQVLRLERLEQPLLKLRLFPPLEGDDKLL